MGKNIPWVTKNAVMRLGGFVLAVLIALSVLAFEMVRTPEGTNAEGSGPDALEIRASSKSLQNNVGRLCSHPRGRNFANPKALEEAATFIHDKFRAMGYDVKYQDVPIPDPAYPPGFCRNVVAKKRGAKTPEQIVVVGAHYDTPAEVGAPGADDNASAVAVLIEIAGKLAEEQTDKTVLFVGFANEEPPFFGSAAMGSSVFARGSSENGDDIKAAVILEMLGCYSDESGSQNYPWPLSGAMSLAYPDKGNFVAFVGNLGSRQLMREAIGEFRSCSHFPAEGVALPSWVPGVDWSDHRSFWAEGIPAIMVTDTSFFRNFRYHTPADTPSTLDYGKMAEVSAGLAQVVRGLAKNGQAE